MQKVIVIVKKILFTNWSIFLDGSNDCLKNMFGENELNYCKVFWYQLVKKFYPFFWIWAYLLVFLNLKLYFNLCTIAWMIIGSRRIVW